MAVHAGELKPHMGPGGSPRHPWSTQFPNRHLYVFIRSDGSSEQQILGRRLAICECCQLRTPWDALTASRTMFLPKLNGRCPLMPSDDNPIFYQRSPAAGSADSKCFANLLKPQAEEQGCTRRRVLLKRGCFNGLAGSLGIGARMSLAHGRQILLRARKAWAGGPAKKGHGSFVH